MNKHTKQQTRPNKFRKTLKKLHLYLGLLVGFLVFFISITGCLYVFKDEVENYQRKEYMFLDKAEYQGKQKLELKTLEKIVENQLQEEYPVHWVNVSIDSARTYQFYYYERDEHAWNYFDEFPIYKSAYVNQYTGEILKVYDEKLTFFNIVKNLHWGYLLNSDWGKYATGIPVIIFMFMTISGIILWWPKNKAARKQRFWFRWKNVKSWKRKNYDMHNIVGFYASIFGLIFSITGLFYAFLVVQALVYFVFSGGNTTYPEFSQYQTVDPIELKTDQTLDIIADKVIELYPDATLFSIDLGNEHMDDHEHPNFEVYVKHLSYSYHKSSSLVFDEHSGRLLHQHDPEDKDFGEKVVSANYDLHVGAILGLPSKIIAFIASLMCASLPVTGFLIWWGKRKKEKK
ncbi:PepSY domain-containing protein [Flavobacterium agricola]|uniref:PepSY domain-containing protein n=1 Tax=Flavobacterium agricola TaxID=2870839 RepID=A0ABY6M0C4_9FLAO|nr:PepSY-associated TM helix domain-containing protein [Flavobacterium agricola]UYW00865.1 PepSY domain-containing protein [Flavobacterium agricola]